MSIVCIGLLVCDIMVKPITESIVHVDSSGIDVLQLGLC